MFEFDTMPFLCMFLLLNLQTNIRNLNICQPPKNKKKAKKKAKKNNKMKQKKKKIKQKKNPNSLAKL